MAGQQYDPYANQYDPNDPYAQYNPNDPYSTEYVGNDPYADEYAETFENEPFASEYDQVPEYDPQEPVYRAYDAGLIPERSREMSMTGPAKVPGRGDPDYYVSLEPCERGSSCSMYDSCDPKCMIRLVGKGYNKDIELSLDKKMDSLVYRIFRCLEDEGILLDGIRLQGLPKKNCLKACLAALCAPFVGLCSGVQARAPCCQTVPQPCCCTSSTCPKVSSGISRRRSNISARCSSDSRRPTVCNTRRPKKHPRRRRSLNCNPCRMARVCQGPNKEDCVLIKISPSLPKVGGVKCEKRSTGVGTDEFPELEILLQGGKKKCATKHRGCACPHCCSGGEMKVIKCRARKPKPCKEPRKEKRKDSFDPKALEAMSEEELVKMLEKLEKESPHKGKQHYDPEVLDSMTEEELIEELERVERGSRDARFSFVSPRSPVNVVLVDSCHSPYGNGNFWESGSHLVVPKKVNRVVDSSNPKQFPRELMKYEVPLKVFSVHETQDGGHPRLNGGPGHSKTKGYSLPKRRRKKKGRAETALLLKEVLRMVIEIVKSRNQSNDSPAPTVEEKPDETSQKCSPNEEVNAIFRRSSIWMSESDASRAGTLEPDPSTSNSPPLRNFLSTKSINVVARLKKSFRSKRSMRKHCKPKFEPPAEDHKSGQNENFEKLRIYVETAKKKPKDSAGFLPIELTEKEGSMHLNTLIT